MSETNCSESGAANLTALLESLIDDVSREWDVGGFFKDTIYGEFAIEVAKRAMAFQKERCAAAVDYIYREGGGTIGDDIRAL